MVYANSVEMTTFPVTVPLRDGRTKIVVNKSMGLVTATIGDQVSPIAEHNTSAPSYRSFLEFWGVVFAQQCETSLAFNQLIQELLAGRLKQDDDCPYLFMDTTQKHGDVEGAHPVLLAQSNGNLLPFNPDDYYMNQAFALADDPRVKFYVVIEDFEGNDFAVGYSTGVSMNPGELPEFREDALSQDKAGIMEAARKGKTSHSMSVTPAPDVNTEGPKPIDDFDDDLPL